MCVCFSCVRIFGKKSVSSSLCPSVCLPAHPHVSTRLPLDGFSLSFTLRTYIKTCGQKIWTGRPTHISTADSYILISTIQRELNVTFPLRQWLRESVTMSRCAFLWALEKRMVYKSPQICTNATHSFVQPSSLNFWRRNYFFKY